MKRKTLKSKGTFVKKFNFIQLLSFCFLILMTESYGATPSKIVVLDGENIGTEKNSCIQKVEEKKDGGEVVVDKRSLGFKSVFQVEEFNGKDLYSKSMPELHVLATNGDTDAQKLFDLYEMSSKCLFTKVLKSDDENDALFVFTNRWITQQKTRTFCDLERLMDYLEIRSARGHVGLRLMLGIIYKSGYLISSYTPPDYQKAYDHLKWAAQHRCSDAFSNLEDLKKRVYNMDDVSLKKISLTFDFANYVLRYCSYFERGKFAKPLHFKFLKSLLDENLKSLQIMVMMWHSICLDIGCILTMAVVTCLGNQ
jgi:hypothetical protein